QGFFSSAMLTGVPQLEGRLDNWDDDPENNERKNSQRCAMILVISADPRPTLIDEISIIFSHSLTLTIIHLLSVLSEIRPIGSIMRLDRRREINRPSGNLNPRSTIKLRPTSGT